MRAHVVIAVALLGSFAASTATAQQKGQVGVAFESGPAIGIVWHVSDNVALIPEVSFSRYWSEYESSLFRSSPYSSSAKSWSVGFGLGTRFYIRRQDELGIYVGPQYEYSRNTVSGE